MQFFIIVLLACFVVFLYVLYILAKDDFVINRKNIPLENFFDTAFLTAIFALFFSRLFYVFIHPKPVFFTILGFFLFPYFPGLSLIGAALGGLVFFLPYLKSKNMPMGKAIDIFALGFLGALPVGYLGLIVLTGNSIRSMFLLIVYTVTLIVSAKFIFPLSLRGKLNDGLFGVAFISFLSFFNILASFLNKKPYIIFSPENIVFLVILILSLAFIFYQELKGKLAR
jgi:hypothetical protein